MDSRRRFITAIVVSSLAMAFSIVSFLLGLRGYYKVSHHKGGREADVKASDMQDSIMLMFCGVVAMVVITLFACSLRRNYSPALGQDAEACQNEETPLRNDDVKGPLIAD
eukprot:scpid83157/ scgid12632/ 